MRRARLPDEAPGTRAARRLVRGRRRAVSVRPRRRLRGGRLLQRRWALPPDVAGNYRYGTFFAKQRDRHPYVGPTLGGNTNYPYLCGGAPGVSASGISAQVQVCTYAATSSGGYNDNTWRSYGVHRDAAGTTLAIRINGSVAAASSIAVLDVNASGF